MGALRYIGSKTRVASAILEFVGPPSGGRFIDGLCGTGAVAATAAAQGWPVAVNDHLLSSVLAAKVRFLARGEAPFVALGGYGAAVAHLNALPSVNGFFWREYSPAGVVGRRYFTPTNASRIDAVRAQIAAWALRQRVTEAERELLLADLASAAARVANTAGTYGHFLSRWTTSSRRPFRMEARCLREDRVDLLASCGDVYDVPMHADDVAYFDPPYTKRQYAAYYHINETLAHGDEPHVVGKSGLRPWTHLASDYCYKRRALPALLDLVGAAPAGRVLLSYSSDGHVGLDDLAEGLEPLGSLAVHALGTVGRYRPNRAASAAASEVTEHVLELVKAPTEQAAALVT